MKHNINLYLVLVISIFASTTYAAGKSLWGDIDDPQAEPPVIVQQPQPTTKTINKPIVSVPAAAAATAVVEPEQKTTCEIIRAQPILDSNLMRSPAIQDALRNNLQLVSAAYKGIFSNTAAINAIYAQYRTLYLKRYCS